MKIMDTGKEEAEAPGAPEKLHSRIVKQIRESRRHYADWRRDAKEDYDFFSGEQWEEDDKQALREQNRPCVTFNRITRTINAVAGLEVQNRQEANYYPREMGGTDAALADLLGQAAKWVREGCNAEDEESEAFQDSLICGQGWTETRLDMEASEEGDILIERCDPMEMVVDHTSKKRNFSDSKWRCKIKSYKRAEFEEKFPDEEFPQTRFFDSTEDDTEQQDNSAGGYSPDFNFVSDDSPSDTCQVGQYQYYEVQNFYVVQDKTGQVQELPEDRYKAAKESGLTQGWQAAPNPKRKRVYKQVFLTPQKILGEVGDCPCNKFTFEAITGLRDRNKNIWFGLVRLMKDPQRWANKWLSQIQHILNTQAKSGKLMYETGAIKNPKQAKKEWAKPDAALELNNGALAQRKIQIHQGSQYPEGLDRLLQYAVLAVNDTPGVNMELMGLANRDQPGVLEESRKQAGVTVLAVFFDALRRYRKENGKTVGKFIQEYISDGRLIRVVGETGAQYVPLLRDKLAIDYDVVVDDAPTSTNIREKTFAALVQILPMIMQAGVPVPPDLIDYTPLPVDLQQKWKKFIREQAADPMQQQLKQLGLQEKDAGVKKTYSEVGLNQAKAQSEVSDANSKASESQNKQQMDLFHSQLDAQHKQQKHSVDLEATKAKANVDVQAKAHQAIEGVKIQQAQAELDMRQKLLEGELKRQEMIAKQQAMSEDRAAKTTEVQSKKLQSSKDDALVKVLSSLAENMSKPKKATVTRKPNGELVGTIQ